MTTKTDITDVTFLIPLRVDSIDRIENLIAVVSFITEHFKTSIHILEASTHNNGFLSKLIPNNVKITFIEDFDTIFHRTHYINRLISFSETPIVSIWDSDVIVSKSNIEQAVELIRSNEADFAFPYDREFLDTSRIIRTLFLNRKDISILEKNKMKMKALYGPDPYGGGFFANKQSYIDSGMENESFYGWGNEDGERINRWEILGYKNKRINRQRNRTFQW